MSAASGNIIRFQHTLEVCEIDGLCAFACELLGRSWLPESTIVPSMTQVRRAIAKLNHRDQEQVIIRLTGLAGRQRTITEIAKEVEVHDGLIKELRRTALRRLRKDVTFAALLQSAATYVSAETELSDFQAEVISLEMASIWGVM